MPRFLFILLLFVSAGLSGPVLGAQQPPDGLPPRPTPFRFVTDQAQLLSPADAKTLEGGLRRYADSTGTQIVVVTVPTLGGRTVADYGRALGEAWGVGQRGKNNGIVLLLSGQERQVTIQAGSGLRAQITPELTNRVISQEMAPSFKQGRYFAGLRAGLNSLMLAANPNYAPDGKQQAATAAVPGAASPGATAGPGLMTDESSLNNELPAASEPASEPFRPSAASPEPSSPGLGMGTIAIGALVIGGILWLVMRMFRRKAPAAPRTVYSNENQSPTQTPDFLGTQSAGGTQAARPVGNYTRGHARQPAPDFLGTGTINRGGGGLSSGMGGILATGAAAAAGAYLGNRMASGGHTDHAGNNIANPNNNAPQNLDPANTYAAGAGGAASSGGFPALEGTGNVEETNPDYFSDLPADSSEPDFFSADETSSYDDTASDDTGGAGFDDTNNNSGSW
ncbi:TPM domain-containing protein [Hymenobacter sp. BT188]|uniref:TPM domain-containing protein n=1 Tax=Hymenobacter sp. BT188 TaxID=2763504 RepID=UPI0016510E0D|nr:TPM domain-containing protein [Hymenobacter sp. BT188]MBC6608099.1 TPM domain-containing protein [Hymenobacter sp. BT188]